MMVLHSDELDVTYSWLLGGLSGRGGSYFALIWPYSAAGLSLVGFLSSQLNLFVLGDEVGTGLAAPHTTRTIVGEDYRVLTPLAAIIGGTLLVAVDLTARVVFQPIELPVGVLTATLGAPSFLLPLLTRSSNR